MIGKIEVRSCSNKVHPATRNMLECYPLKELKQYARSIGVKPGRTKDQTIHRLMVSGKATICASLGN
jgi:hypothetical protein